MNLSWERWRLAGAFLISAPRLAGEDAGAPRFMVPMHPQSERRLSMNSERPGTTEERRTRREDLLPETSAHSVAPQCPPSFRALGAIAVQDDTSMKPLRPVHGLNARQLLEVEAFHKAGRGFPVRRVAKRSNGRGTAFSEMTQSRFLVILTA